MHSMALITIVSVHSGVSLVFHLESRESVRGFGNFRGTCSSDVDGVLRAFSALCFMSGRKMFRYCNVVVRNFKTCLFMWCLNKFSDGAFSTVLCLIYIF